MSGTPEQKIPVVCPSCQTQMAVRPEHAGKRARCPKCQTTFDIPAASAAPQQSAIPPIVNPPVGMPQEFDALSPYGASSPHYSSQPTQQFPQQPFSQQQPLMAQPAFPQQQPFGQSQQYLHPGQPSQQGQTSNAFPQLSGTDSMTDRVYRNAAETGDIPSQKAGAFSLEKKGLQAGVVGGVVMMLIAVVWFFAGLAGGVIFFYPPILFIIGLVGFIQGLVSGNVSGKKNRRQY